MKSRRWPPLGTCTTFNPSTKARRQHRYTKRLLLDALERPARLAPLKNLGVGPNKEVFVGVDGRSAKLVVVAGLTRPLDPPRVNEGVHPGFSGHNKLVSPFGNSLYGARKAMCNPMLVHPHCLLEAWHEDNSDYVVNTQITWYFKENLLKTNCAYNTKNVQFHK